MKWIDSRRIRRYTQEITFLTECLYKIYLWELWALIKTCILSLYLNVNKIQWYDLKCRFYVDFNFSMTSDVETPGYLLHFVYLGYHRIHFWPNPSIFLSLSSGHLQRQRRLIINPFRWRTFSIIFVKLVILCLMIIFLFFSHTNKILLRSAYVGKLSHKYFGWLLLHTHSFTHEMGLKNLLKRNDYLFPIHLTFLRSNNKVRT